MGRSAIHRRVLSGRWAEVRPRVYCLAGAPATRQRQLFEALLWAGEGAVLSHFTAAELWNLDGIKRSTEVDVLRDKAQKRTPIHLADVRFRRSTTLWPKERVSRSGLPVTSVTRTLLDLAGEVSEKELELAFLDARRRGLVDVAAFQSRLRRIPCRGRSGIGVLKRVVLGDQLQSDSPLEAAFVRIVANARLPPPVPQYTVFDDEGMIGRFDYAWLEARLVVECDSRKHHSDFAAFEGDRAKSNRLSAIGVRLLRVTNKMVRRPDELVALLRRALAAKRSLPPLPPLELPDD